MALVFVDMRDLEAAGEIRTALEADGHEVALVDAPGDIESRMRRAEQTALVLTSHLEDRVARGMLAIFASQIPRPPVIGFTNIDSPEQRAQLTEAHELDDCLALPPDPDEVRVVMAQQLDRYRLQLETGIIGRTEAVREMLERVHLLAPVNSTVLLTGESGTGKELVARGIHRLSPRRGKPFIAVNCAALPESLLESELFGHEKGAFTGATSLRRGMFELADGGTLLLDEIAEMPLPTQTRLLRVLESRNFMRVGGDREIEVDVRVIAATNRDLARAVREGHFRRDLFYRLNVLHIALPPLRERKQDIPILMRRFIEEFSLAHDRDFKGLDPETMRILLDFDWPGNVRELRNLIESMVVLAPGTMIRPEDIPAEIRSGGRSRVPVRADSAPLPPAVMTDAPQLQQMEFIFRTLVELKIDVEDLRQQFERYKTQHPELMEFPMGFRPGSAEIELPDHAVVEGDVLHHEPEPVPEEPAIAFEPGMTMAELEKEAIIATLRDVGGNRRKAAERLQIGERTLYRKLKEYDIEL
jgi:DNA-binding NtrC family response regulator